MLDHIGFPIADYARSKAFYEKALAPLGYGLVMEVPQTENGHSAAGFGRDGKPDFWIGGEGKLNGVVTSPSRQKTARRSMRFTQPRLPPAPKTTARRACVRIITRTTTAPSCSIPTATTSKPSATRRPDALYVEHARPPTTYA